MSGMSGYVALKEAATKLNRSVARTRQYVEDGSLASKRDDMGHILVSEASLAQFAPKGRVPAGAMAGYVTLKVAAAKIHRSVARTRQYVSDGKLEWVRDQMGHIMVQTGSLAEFTPPERGEARASGISAGTQLRHSKATKKLVDSMVADGPAKATTIQVLNALISALAEKAAAEGDEDEGEEEGDELEVVDAPAEPAVEPATEPEQFQDLLSKL